VVSLLWLGAVGDLVASCDLAGFCQWSGAVFWWYSSAAMVIFLVYK